MSNYSFVRNFDPQHAIYFDHNIDNKVFQTAEVCQGAVPGCIPNWAIISKGGRCHGKKDAEG